MTKRSRIVSDDADIKATVLDYTNSNPLAVRLTDTAGDYVSAGGGAQYTEDAAAASDPTGTMVMAVRADALGSVTSADGDNIAARATNKGELYVKHVDTVSVSGDVNVLTVPAPLSSAGAGGEAGALRVTIASDSTGLLSVDDNGGSLTVDGTVTVNGDVAHDAADSGNPVKIGAKAETSPKGITLVADGDRTDLLADADGMLMVKVGTSNADLISERVADTGGTSTAFTNFSAVASTRNYVTAIHIYNSSATAGYVDFRDGAAGAVLFTAAAPAGGGMSIASPVPLFKTTANTALAYDVSGGLSTVYINVSGYQSKA